MSSPCELVRYLLDLLKVCKQALQHPTCTHFRHFSCPSPSAPAPSTTVLFSVLEPAASSSTTLSSLSHSIYLSRTIVCTLAHCSSHNDARTNDARIMTQWHLHKGCTVEQLVGQASESLSYLAVGLEDGSNYAVVRVMGTGELYIALVDAQNSLGQGTGWRDYHIDETTGEHSELCASGPVPFCLCICGCLYHYVCIYFCFCAWLCPCLSSTLGFAGCYNLSSHFGSGTYDPRLRQHLLHC